MTGKPAIIVLTKRGKAPTNRPDSRGAAARLRHANLGRKEGRDRRHCAAGQRFNEPGLSNVRDAERREIEANEVIQQLSLQETGFSFQKSENRAIGFSLGKSRFGWPMQPGK